MNIGKLLKSNNIQVTIRKDDNKKQNNPAGKENILEDMLNVYTNWNIPFQNELRDLMLLNEKIQDMKTKIRIRKTQIS